MKVFKISGIIFNVGENTNDKLVLLILLTADCIHTSKCVIRSVKGARIAVLDKLYLRLRWCNSAGGSFKRIHCRIGIGVRDWPSFVKMAIGLISPANAEQKFIILYQRLSEDTVQLVPKTTLKP